MKKKIIMFSMLVTILVVSNAMGLPQTQSKLTKPIETSGWTDEQCDKLEYWVGWLIGGTAAAGIDVLLDIIAAINGGALFRSLFVAYGAGLVIAAILYYKNCKDHAELTSTTCPLCAN